MDKSSIAVEVVYALADKQKLLQMTVPAGTTVREAALRSGLDAHFPVSISPARRWESSARPCPSLKSGCWKRASASRSTDR